MEVAPVISGRRGETRGVHLERNGRKVVSVLQFFIEYPDGALAGPFADQREAEREMDAMERYVHLVKQQKTPDELGVQCVGLIPE